VDFRLNVVFVEAVEKVHDAAHCLGVWRLSFLGGEHFRDGGAVDYPSLRCSRVGVVAEVLRNGPSALLVRRELFFGQMLRQIGDLFQR
jgi:hypothetical protein